ncbi:unnamed protein product [Linum trigynum]|uniref:Uncharacterized protein n=1 Tax=Linum trigynum TaxID=586398 RepID=A0AAV2CLU8_9ROSI
MERSSSSMELDSDLSLKATELRLGLPDYYGGRRAARGITGQQHISDHRIDSRQNQQQEIFARSSVLQRVRSLSESSASNVEDCAPPPVPVGRGCM